MISPISVANACEGQPRFPYRGCDNAKLTGTFSQPLRPGPFACVSTFVHAAPAKKITSTCDAQILRGDSGNRTREPSTCQPKRSRWIVALRWREAWTTLSPTCSLRLLLLAYKVSMTRALLRRLALHCVQLKLLCLSCPAQPARYTLLSCW